MVPGKVEAKDVNNGMFDGELQSDRNVAGMSQRHDFA